MKRTRQKKAPRPTTQRRRPVVRSPEPDPDPIHVEAWLESVLFDQAAASIAMAVPSRIGADDTLSCGCNPLELDDCPHWPTRPTPRADQFKAAIAQSNWWLREAASLAPDLEAVLEITRALEFLNGVTRTDGRRPTRDPGEIAAIHEALVRKGRTSNKAYRALAERLGVEDREIRRLVAKGRQKLEPPPA